MAEAHAKSHKPPPNLVIRGHAQEFVPQENLYWNTSLDQILNYVMMLLISLYDSSLLTHRLKIPELAWSVITIKNLPLCENPLYVILKFAIKPNFPFIFITTHDS